jgi:hypothetical protein
VGDVGYYAGRRLEVEGKQYGYGERLPDSAAHWPHVERFIRGGTVMALEVSDAGEPIGLPHRSYAPAERFYRTSLELHRQHVADGDPAAARGGTGKRRRRGRKGRKAASRLKQEEAPPAGAEG